MKWMQRTFVAFLEVEGKTHDGTNNCSWSIFLHDRWRACAPDALQFSEPSFERDEAPRVQSGPFIDQTRHLLLARPICATNGNINRSVREPTYKVERLTAPEFPTPPWRACLYPMRVHVHRPHRTIPQWQQRTQTAPCRLQRLSTHPEVC